MEGNTKKGASGNKGIEGNGGKPLKRLTQRRSLP